VTGGGTPGRPRPGEAHVGGDTGLVRRSEEEIFEPVAGLKESSEAAPIIDLVDLVVKSANQEQGERYSR